MNASTSSAYYQHLTTTIHHSFYPLTYTVVSGQWSIVKHTHLLWSGGPSSVFIPTFTFKNKGKLSMFTFNCNGRLVVLDKPVVMGIINVTPDSFYEGSRQQTSDDVLKEAEKMISEGATILDIGGQSTRPGSKQLSDEDELARVLPAIQSIHQHFPAILLSIDTFHASVAKHAVKAGASFVNDISSGDMDDAMIETVAALKVPYISMHMKGTPATMHQNPSYENVTLEVIDYFIKKIATLRQAGIHDIIIDPGFGFGKNIAHNFELLKNLEVFSILHKPLLVGVSRKSTIYKILGTTAEEALNGTTVLNTVALMKGANVLRVHDVKEAAEAIKLVCAITT